jgi:DNA-binding NarL/FixJ family response regulator
MNALVIHPHIVWRAGLSGILKKIPGIGKISDSAWSEALPALIDKKEIDVVIMDLEFTSRQAMLFIRKLRQYFPSVYQLGICRSSECGTIAEAYEAGINGLISDQLSSEEMHKVVEHAVNRKNYFMGEFSEKLLKHFMLSDRRRRSKPAAFISKREEEVLRLICEQMDNKTIAQKLFISDLTVRRHRQNLLQKTHSSNTAGLVVFAIKNGIYRVYENAL